MKIKQWPPDISKNTRVRRNDWELFDSCREYPILEILLNKEIRFLARGGLIGILQTKLLDLRAEYLLLIQEVQEFNEVFNL